VKGQSAVTAFSVSVARGFQRKPEKKRRKGRVENLSEPRSSSDADGRRGCAPEEIALSGKGLGGVVLGGDQKKV